MHEKEWNRMDGASGLAAFVTGAAGGALERGWPSGNDPTAVAAFVAEHRAAILWQSMLFVLSAGIYLWFLGGLRRAASAPEQDSNVRASHGDMVADH